MLTYTKKLQDKIWEMESRQPKNFPSIERGGHLIRKVHMNTKTMKVFTTYIEPNIIYEFNGVRIVEDRSEWKHLLITYK
jgi:hypothetical protein